MMIFEKNKLDWICEIYLIRLMTVWLVLSLKPIKWWVAVHSFSCWCVRIRVSMWKFWTPCQDHSIILTICHNNGECYWFVLFVNHNAWLFQAFFFFFWYLIIRIIVNNISKHLIHFIVCWNWVLFLLDRWGSIYYASSYHCSNMASSIWFITSAGSWSAFTNTYSFFMFKSFIRCTWCTPS